LGLHNIVTVYTEWK